MRNHSVISHTSRPLPYSGHPRDLRSKTRQLPLSGCPAPLPISGTRPPPSPQVHCIPVHSIALLPGSRFAPARDAPVPVRPRVAGDLPGSRARAYLISKSRLGTLPHSCQALRPSRHRKSHPDVEHRGPLASSWCRSIVSPLRIVIPVLLGFPLRLHTFSVKHTQE